MGAIEIAEAILSRAMQSVEVSAQNMANMTTPGYKSSRAFPSLISDYDPGSSSTLPDNSNTQLAVDFTTSKLSSTGNPLDLAISGGGFFEVRAGNSTYYTRNGQFHRDSEGRLVSASGMVLQSDSGDVSVETNDPEILPDGTVLDNGNPVARIRIEDFADLHQLQPAIAGTFAAPIGQEQDAVAPQIRQGLLEQANVNTADEMLSIMAALRSAQSGQKLVQAYDDLMGRAVTAFGQM